MNQLPNQLITRALPHLLASGLVLGATIWLYARLAVWPDTPDGLLHLHRVRALAEAWQHGVLYPRWFPDFAFGYGHPILNFYAPAYYVTAALPHWLGLDILTANRLALAAWFGLSGAACYAMLRRWTGLWPALAGTTLFLFFPYRIYDLFIRGALPEFAAFFWPPLLVYGYDRLLRPTIIVENEGSRMGDEGAACSALIPHPSSLILTALAWAGLILTHNLTALMAGILWLLVSAIMVARTLFTPSSLIPHPPSLILQLGGPLLLGALLSGFYIAPVLLEAGWVGIGAGSDASGSAAGYAQHAVRGESLWTGAARYPYPGAAAPTVPLPAFVGIIALAGALSALLPWARQQRALLWAAAALTLVAVWLTTAASLPLWDWGASILGKLQFPWRWQTAIALTTALTLGLTLHLLQHAPCTRLRPAAYALSPLMILYCAVYAIAGLQTPAAPYASQEITRTQMWAFDFEHGQVGATWTGEFLPQWVTAPRWTIGRAPETENKTEGERMNNEDSTPRTLSLQPSAFSPIIMRPVQLGYQTAVYAVGAPQALTLRMPHFYYPAWQATRNGQPVLLRPDGELGWLAVDLPAGQHALAVRWAATPAVWLGRALFGIGWLVVAWLLWRKGQRKAHPDQRHGHWAGWLLSAGAWLLVGLAAIAGMANPLAARGVNLAAPAPLAVDFDSVHLSAVEARRIAAADTDIATEIVLHWTARDPAITAPPLHAFVHVTQDGGAPVAQYDTRIGGEYLPPPRIHPGLPLTSRHPLTLPPDLPPGRYTVLAGVYFAHQPDQPLIAAGEVVPRVAIGALEIGDRSVVFQAREPGEASP